VNFADRSNLIVRLIYSSPTYGGYPRIERYWGSLERFWNGYLFDLQQRDSHAGQQLYLEASTTNGISAQPRKSI